MHLAKKKIIFLVFLICMILFYFLFRNSLLNFIVEQKVSAIQQRYKLSITFGKLQMYGLKSIRISNLEVISETEDTIIQASKIELNPRMFATLFGKIQIKTLHIDSLDTRLNSTLLEIWLNRNKRDTFISIDKPDPTGYAGRLSGLEKQLFVTIPDEIAISNSSFRYQRENLYSIVKCTQFSYKNNLFEGSFLTKDNISEQAFAVSGTLDKRNHMLNAVMSQVGHNQVKLPYIGPRWQAMLAFDSLHLQTYFKSKSGNNIEIDGEASATNLTIAHKQISPEPVIITKGGISFYIRATQNLVELDSTSNFSMNGFTFSPYASYSRLPEKCFSLRIIRKEFQAQSLIAAFPKGLFLTFKGMQTSGNLVFSLSSILNFSNPDSSKFSSKLEGKSLAISRYGQTNFSMMNESFQHDVYEDETKVASFIVGPENPDFVSLNEVSTYLQYSVLTGEDGGFFYHRGFSEDAFRESIAANLKEHRFARGGSTLTMQLVKNVFLSHQKTISRKVEEALIVWMIENLHLVSKERMFEVYLNIIEWGPGIYGIKKASAYYFKKLPKELTLAESIYLSAIIPRPKGFRYFFEKNGELKSFMTDYYKLVSGIMLRRSQITDADTTGLSAHVTLRGPAKLMLQSPDTMRIDSLLILPMQEQLPAFAVPEGK